jgi:hypothetical protein
MRFSKIAIMGGMLGALSLMAGASPSFADAVGLVQRLQNAAYGTEPAGARTPKYRRDGIQYREVIETAKNSAIDIGFVDGSDMTIGANAQVVIDDYVFDQDKSTGQAVLSLSQGAFRWVTGIMPEGSVRFETPTATITVRGTTVKVAVKSNGDTIVAVLDGQVLVIPKGKGDPVKLIDGQSARVTPEGIVVVEQVLSVTDRIVDDGWAQATDFGNDRNRHDNDKGGGSGNH